jgi:FolB domain-containing protein
MPPHSEDRVHLKGLELECIVGVRPHERKRPQRVYVDVSMGVDTSHAGRSARIALTVDYARVADEICTLLRFREYRLIEMATEELCAMLFAAHPVLTLVELRLEKPDALRGRALAGAVSVTRTRESYPVTRREFDGGYADRILETHEAIIELVTLSPGRVFSPGPRRHVMWVTQGSIEGAPGLSEQLRVEAPLVAGPEPTSIFVCQLRGAASGGENEP